MPPAQVPGAWEHETVAQLENDARSVVGPDEAYGDITYEQMDAGHWKTLAAVLAEHGVQVEPERLASLPHDVELTRRVRAHRPAAARLSFSGRATPAQRSRLTTEKEGFEPSMEVFTPITP